MWELVPGIALREYSSGNTGRTAQGLLDELRALELVWAGGCESPRCCGEEAEPEEPAECGQDQGA